MKAPSQQQRYHFIKQEIASAHLRSKEVTLQQMSHQTEYFLAKDLFYLWQNKDADFTTTVKTYK